MGGAGLRTGKLRIDKQAYSVGGKLIISESKTKAQTIPSSCRLPWWRLLVEYKKGVFSDLIFTIICHVSSAATLNTYAHITDKMRRKAARNIDHGITKAEAALMLEQTDEP